VCSILLARFFSLSRKTGALNQLNILLQSCFKELILDSFILKCIIKARGLFEYSDFSPNDSYFLAYEI
jgi:hypothetical protein